uniref:Uncharacterized protein n=1 Tax=viral metagenome TaxID=1070528 RepID=A0A6M3LNB5_9ZZZZ
MLNLKEEKTMTTREWGVRWTEFNKADQRVTKERFFNTEEKLDTFCNKLQEKANFNAFEEWLDREMF